MIRGISPEDKRKLDEMWQAHNSSKMPAMKQRRSRSTDRYPLLGFLKTDLPGRVMGTGRSGTDWDHSYHHAGEFWPVQVDQTALYQGIWHGPTDYRLYNSEVNPKTGINATTQPLTAESLVVAYPIAGKSEFLLFPFDAAHQNYEIHAHGNTTPLSVTPTTDFATSGHVAATFTEIPCGPWTDTYRSPNAIGTDFDDYWPHGGVGNSSRIEIRTPGIYAIEAKVDFAGAAGWTNAGGDGFVILGLAVGVDFASVGTPLPDYVGWSPGSVTQWVGFATFDGEVDNSIKQKETVSGHAYGVFNATKVATDITDAADPLIVRLYCCVLDHTATTLGTYQASYARACVTNVALQEGTPRAANNQDSIWHSWGWPRDDTGEQTGPGAPPPDPPE